MAETIVVHDPALHLVSCADTHITETRTRFKGFRQVVVGIVVAAHAGTAKMKPQQGSFCLCARPMRDDVTM